MSTLPLTEAVMLEIQQSLCGSPYQKKEKSKFATGQISLEKHKTMGMEILMSIFDALDIDPQSQMDALNNFIEFGNASKFLELNTWTFDADQRQVLWALLNHFYVPGLARRVGFWNLSQTLDKGMPGGRFWYLPELYEETGKLSLYMPVAQVMDWLLDLLGMSLEEFADQRSESSDGVHESLRRSLYKWRKGTTIRIDTITQYFSDDVELDFKGAFSADNNRSPAEQFTDALEFVSRKDLTADKLRLEIPMTQPGRLELILEGHADEDEQATFVTCLAERYAAPDMRTIRQRLLLARAVQDGYERLLKSLCPGVNRQNTDPHQNKLLQLFAIYKGIYNLTIGARQHCGELGKDAENDWFERHLPAWGKRSLFLNVLPMQPAVDKDLAHLLTRLFYEMQPGTELEDYFGLDEQTYKSIAQRILERDDDFFDELKRERKLIERMQSTSPWRALQGEHSYWVVSQVAQKLNPLAKKIAIQRMRELAATPSQTVQAILLELDGYLNGERKGRSKDTQAKVQVLIDEAESNNEYDLGKADILQYKAKHLLASNDRDGAAKLFKKALDASLKRNYGPLRGKIAQDCFATEVADRKLIANNHEKYYREMLAGGLMAEDDNIPSIEEAARRASNYFWNDLYKPYPGIQPERRRGIEVLKKTLEELIPLFSSGDQYGLQSWIKNNSKLLNSSLPDVDGNSVLMALLKGHTYELSQMRLMTPAVPQRRSTILVNWRHFLGQLAKESPKQLNITDIKGQTPLMLMAEAGDTELVEIMLQAGADPNIQDWQGMTALHSACKTRVNSCVDALIDHPCQLDKLTHEGRTALHTACWAGNIHAVKRLLDQASEMVWQRDTFGQTPLELAEELIEHPDAWKALAKRRAQDGARCASKQELETIVRMLEEAVPHTQ